MTNPKLPFRNAKCKRCGRYTLVGRNKCTNCDQQLELTLNNTETKINAVRQGH